MISTKNGQPKITPEVQCVYSDLFASGVIFEVFAPTLEKQTSSSDEESGTQLGGRSLVGPCYDVIPLNIFIHC